MKNMAQITYEDKVALNENPSVANINKVTDDDMNEIKSTINTNTPVGVIQAYAGSTAPDGWLICDGSAISRTIYSDLFSVIGTTYGTGDGSTTFNLPNIKGRSLVGVDPDDTDFNVVGKTGGEKTHTLTVDEMPSHNHQIDGWAIKWGQGISGTYINAVMVGGTTPSNNPYMANSTTLTKGGGQAHNNLSPYAVVNFIISY